MRDMSDSLLPYVCPKEEFGQEANETKKIRRIVDY